MAIYAIGDLHGSYDSFRRLVDQLEFDPAADRLWLVGDLVNRGPGALECLRFVRGLGEAAVTTLGNHDLALLRLARQPDALQRVNDTQRPVLAADDGEELLDWLRRRPLFHRDVELGWNMVHAGLIPEWTVDDAATLAGEVETVLRGPDCDAFLAHMFGNEPDHWDDSLAGWDRLRVIVNAMTRMRFCRTNGSMDLEYKKTLAEAPPGIVPWFAVPGRRSAEARVVFGHWAALERVAWPEHNVWAIDTGCAWGGRLTAMRLDTPEPQLHDCACGD